MRLRVIVFTAFAMAGAFWVGSFAAKAVAVAAATVAQADERGRY